MKKAKIAVIAFFLISVSCFNLELLKQQSPNILLSNLLLAQASGDNEDEEDDDNDNEEDDCPWYVSNCEARNECGNDHYDCDALFREVNKGSCEKQDCWSIFIRSSCVTRFGTYIG